MRYALAALAGTSLAACGIDLFHSTDFDTLCATDPTADGCALPDGTAPDGFIPDGPAPDYYLPDGRWGGDGPEPEAGPGEGGKRDADADAGPVPPTNFCSWSVATAHDNARRACAWLGACATAVEGNEFGTCLDNALRTYDCTLNQGRPVTSKPHKYWDCLWQATSCTDVRSCVTAGASGASCVPNGLPFPVCSGDVIYECPGAGTTPTAFVNCVGVGQTCDVTAVTNCTSADASCPTAAICQGTRIVDCVSGSNDGVDCADYGAGSCVMGGDAGPSCVPSAGTACTPNAIVTCSGTVASGCPGGKVEQIDCLNLMEDAGNCIDNTPGRPWDVSRVCVKNDSNACAAACKTDGGLTACHRGKAVDIACTAYGLHACAADNHLSLPSIACTP